MLEINIWGNRDVIDLSGEKHTEKSVAELIKSLFTPTLLFLDKRGAEILRINGCLPPERLMLALRYAAERTLRTRNSPRVIFPSHHPKG